MNKLRAAALAVLVTLPACEGFKEAMSAHVDVAARAGSQELTVQRLAEMMGRTPQVPVTMDVARSIADVWVDYQLLGKAAAHNDSLSDTALVDESMWPVLTRSRIEKWVGTLRQNWHVDTANLDQKFAQGDLLAASHILFQVPQGQAATGSDSVRRKAEQVLKQTTAANFAAMAQKYGSDATKDRGGDLGVWVFGRGQMIPEFEQAVHGLKPGEIGPLVKTQYGYHIVRRKTYAESKDAFRQAYDSLEMYKLDSAYVTGTENAGKIQVKPNAAKLVKEVAADPTAHRGDKSTIATSVVGNYTAGEVARWITGSPQPQQTRMQIRQANDSMIPDFVKFLVRNDLFLHQADSAHVQLDSTELASIRQAFRIMLINSWRGLRVEPALLRDSAKTVPERERLAAAKVDAFMDRLMQQQEQYVDVQTPLSNALNEKYDAKVNTVGLERAVATAQKLRAAADSAQTKGQPRSAVPMPTTPPDTSRKK
jgi:PPIC-type PPIASE domain